MVFKMRGNPFKRNFKTGSPLAQPAAPTVDPTIPTTPTEEITMGPEELVSEVTEGEITTKTFETPGKGYTPPTFTPAGDLYYSNLSEQDKIIQDDKWTKANTREFVVNRQEIFENTELTPQQRMSQGTHVVKYWQPDDEGGHYRVRLFEYNNIGTEENPIYSSTGRGPQLPGGAGDMSLGDYDRSTGNIEETEHTKNIEGQSYLQQQGVAQE